MFVLAAYLVGNLALAVVGFYVATSRPEWARLVWVVTALFLVGSVGLVYDLITNPALMRVLMRF